MSGGDVGFGPDRALALHQRFGVDAGNPVAEQQRRARHAHLPAEPVLRCKLVAEDLGDIARCGLFQLGA